MWTSGKVGNIMLGSSLVLCVLLLLGVSGADPDRESVSMMERDSVTLNTNITTNQRDRIKWYFNDIRIAEIRGDLSKICTDVQCNEGTERFRDRLKLDHQTGSLTIMNIRTTHSGEYHLEITSRNSEKIFNLAVHGVSERDEMKRKSVNEGESVTLDPGVLNNPNHVMTWYYNEILIAEITGDQSKICTDVQCEERFRDRLKLNQTGSLTIMNTRNTDSGEYKLLITSKSSSFSIRRIFSVAVTGSGLSPGAIGGIVVFVVVAVVLVAAAAVTAAVIYYRKREASNGGRSPRRNHSGVATGEDGGDTYLALLETGKAVTSLTERREDSCSNPREHVQNGKYSADNQNGNIPNGTSPNLTQ